MNLRETAYLLLSERVPLGYENPEETCRRLATEFVEKRRPGETTVDPGQLEALASLLVDWVRAKGYRVMDDPLPPYGMPRVESLGPWTPITSPETLSPL